MFGRAPKKSFSLQQITSRSIDAELTNIDIVMHDVNIEETKLETLVLA